MSVIDQAEIMNIVHGAKAVTHIVGAGLGACSLQRWRVYLPEYTLPALKYPMLAFQIAGRARIRRVLDGRDESQDYVMGGDFTIIPKMKELQWRVHGYVDIAVLIFENKETCKHLERLYYKHRQATNGQVQVGAFSNSLIYSSCIHLFNIYNRKMSSAFFEEYFNATFRSLEMYVQKFFGEDDEELIFPGSNFRVSYSYPVSYALQRLDTAVGIKIHIEDIAHELNTSPSVLIRRFKQEMGITPLQYLMYKRINHAKKLLAETDLDVVSVATRCGFFSQSHLTRHFSKHFGVPPATYRKHVKTGK